MCSAENRELAITYAASYMGGPTAVAALTTAAAGTFMLPSTVLAYIQVGILVTVMNISWIHSTFSWDLCFLLVDFSMDLGSFHIHAASGETEAVEIQGLQIMPTTQLIATSSESTLSTSSTGYDLHPSTCDNHELESLKAEITEAALIKDSIGQAVP
jgi:hypothetical protein